MVKPSRAGASPKPVLAVGPIVAPAVSGRAESEFLNGEPIPEKVVIQDREYDSADAEEVLSYAC